MFAKHIELQGADPPFFPKIHVANFPMDLVDNYPRMPLITQSRYHLAKRKKTCCFPHPPPFCCPSSEPRVLLPSAESPARMYADNDPPLPNPSFSSSAPPARFWSPRRHSLPRRHPNRDGISLPLPQRSPLISEVRKLERMTKAPSSSWRSAMAMAEEAMTTA